MKLELDNNRVIRDLYALVNSLTDPIEPNRDYGGSVYSRKAIVIIESYMDISLKGFLCYESCLD
jgi:hypothetical protein